MDAHLLRLQHMSSAYQQQLSNNNSNTHQRNNNQTNTANRQHYSSRQQQQQLEPRLNTQQKQIHLPSSAASSGASAGDETPTTHISSDDHHHHQQQQHRYQLSSASASTSKTNSSQQAMLGHHSNKVAHQQHMMHHHQQQQQHHHQQQQQLQRHRQQQQAAMAAASNGGAGHRQAALQSHTLGAQGKSLAGASKQTMAAAAAADNLTSSSSDHTIDERHHLAAGSSSAAAAGAYGSHRLGARCAAATDASSSLSSSEQSGSRFLLGVLFTLAELLLFITVFLWLYWCYQHDDGLAWQNDRKAQFNTHAALMLLGFVFLNGQAMLIYRSFQCCSKIYTKILHTILFVLATSAISLGLILGFTGQENVLASMSKPMHFYSLHAWCGLATVGLFVFQFVFGFISFLILLCCDQATSKFRAALLPIHKTFGLIIFSLAIATCLMGLLQTGRSRLSAKMNKQDYHDLGEAGIVINLIGVCLICLAILMPYIIRNLDIKRSFRSELLDRHLKLSQLDMRI